MSKNYYPYFTDGEAEAQRLSDFSKATQQISGRSRISGGDFLDPSPVL